MKSEPGRKNDKTARGRRYEKLAEEFLIENGYEIIERNWRAGHREIDLIAQRDNTVVFVEVKAALTGKFGHPAERVDTAKRQNLIGAAEQYILEKRHQNVDYRFDLITFAGGRLEHFRDAFRADSEP